MSLFGAGSAQAKVLKKQLFTRLAVVLTLYVVFFAAFVYLYEQYATEPVENWLKNGLSSEWEYRDEAGMQEFRFDVAQRGEKMENWESVRRPEGGWAVRNVSLFNALRFFKVPLCIFAGLAGLLAILLVELSRIFRHFDSLSHAVNQLFKDKNAPLQLPEELEIVKSELSELQERSLSDERAAAAAEERRKELVAYLAHDIRTPLTSVLGYLSLLKDDDSLSDEERERYIGIAYDKALHLDYLVDEFFDITRSNLQEIPLQRERLDVAMLCAQVLEGFYPEAENRSLELALKTPATRFAFVDGSRLARAIANILRNALAYANRNSTVSLSLMEADTQDGGSGFCIEIDDEGREISPEHLQDVFDKFFRESEARSTDGGGAGLGLAIASEIVQSHGGSIKASCADGHTRFTLFIPDSAAQ